VRANLIVVRVDSGRAGAGARAGARASDSDSGNSL